MIQHALGQAAVLLHGVLPNSLAELLAGDVAIFFRFVGDDGVVQRPGRTTHAELLVRIPQGIEHEYVGVEMISLIAPQ